MAAINQQNLLGELIPDVYIRKITLESSGTPLVESNPHIDHKRENLEIKEEESSDALIVTLDLLMKEKLNNDLIGTWFANQDLNKYLQIKVFQSVDPKVTALLSAGTDLLDLIDSSKNVSDDDLRMKLAASVFNVNSSEEVLERMMRRTTVSVVAANKQGTGVEPKITQHKETVDSDGNRVFDISFRQRFEVRTSKPEHLAYFAVTSLDLQALARDFDIDFDSIGLEAMNGKVVSDLVIDDYEIVNQSFSFLDVQGKIWAGSVHKLPNGQYRSGASETTDSFNLERFPVSNTKLQDFRDIKEIQRLTLDFSVVENSPLRRNTTKILMNNSTEPVRTPVYFSEMSLTRDKDGDSKFFFSIDFDKLVQENAVFGNLFAEASPRLKMLMLRNTQIRSMRVLRRRIKGNTSLNKLGSPHGLGVFDKNEPLELVAHSNEKSWKSFSSTKTSSGTLREVELVTEEEAPMVRHFTGMDLSMSEVTDGMYQYVVELEVDDATIEFLVSKTQELFKAKNVLSEYLAEASKLSMSKYIAETRDPHIEHPSEFAGTSGRTAGAFDIASNKFTQHFIDSQRAKYKGSRSKAAPWIAPVAVYADIFDMFTNAFKNRQERQKLIKSLHSYVSPDTGNPNGISTMIKLIDDLISTLERITKVTVTKSPRRTDGSTASTFQSPVLNVGRTSRWTFKVEKSFDQVFDSNIVKGVGLDYLSKGEDETRNDDGLRTISNFDYGSRVKLETLKYFKTPEPNIDMSFGGEQFTEKDNIKETNYSFLSPSRVDFVKKSIILSDGGKTLPGKTTGVKKERKKRFVEHIDNGSVNKEDAAREICTSILYSNSLSSPAEVSISKGVKNKNDASKNNGKAIKKTFDNFFSNQSSMVVEPVRISVESRGDFPSLEPERKLPVPEISFECQTESEAPIVSEDEEDIVFLETFPVTMFYSALSKNVAKKGTSNVKNILKPNFRKKEGTISAKERKISSPISTLNLRELKTVSTSGQPEAVKTIHGLNQIMTENNLKKLPNQLKAVFLQTASQNVVRSVKMRGLSSDDAVEKSKFAAINAIDYEMLVQVEYFAGFERNEYGEILIRKPIWKLLTDAANNRLIGKEILCRTLPYENTMIGILPNKGMTAGIYDEYFILKPKFKELKTDVFKPQIETGNIVTRSIIEDLNLNFPNVKVVKTAPSVVASNINNEKEGVLTTMLPVGLKIIETYQSGETKETKMKIKDKDESETLSKQNNPELREVSLGFNGERVEVQTLLAVELLATDCQTQSVEDEFTSNNLVVPLEFAKEVEQNILVDGTVSVNVLSDEELCPEPLIVEENKTKEEKLISSIPTMTDLIKKSR